MTRDPCVRRVRSADDKMRPLLFISLTATILVGFLVFGYRSGSHGITWDVLFGVATSMCLASILILLARWAGRSMHSDANPDSDGGESDPPDARE